MKEATIQLEELVCPMCATKIETALKNVKGIFNVEVLYNSSKAKLQIDETIISETTLIEAINKVGYEVMKVRIK